jgi:hypothetical protein
MVDQWEAVSAEAMMPTPMLAATSATNVHTVERTVRSFVHSERNDPEAR